MAQGQAQPLKFELAAHEVVDLLVGNKIYDNPPYVVVRELLQNAVDACRLRRAVEPAYTPEIRVVYQPGSPGCLSVVDNGIGMSEHVVRQYFLQVGRSYYSSPDFRVRYGTYNFAPIARFGIGVLSCFLVADRVVVVSRHHDPGAEATALDIEGVHSSITRSHPGPATPVGTAIHLTLQAGVGYDDVAQVVSHWARHVELPITVVHGGRETVVPPDDGSGFLRELLDPMHYLLRDSRRFGQVRTRRLEFDGEDGITGFIEYAYLQAPGKLRRYNSKEGRGILEFYGENVPQVLSLDGIFVTRWLPTFMTALRDPAVAFDLNLSSRRTELQLRLDRKQFVDSASLRHLIDRLDTRLYRDLVAAAAAAGLNQGQLAEAVSDLLDIRRLLAYEGEHGPSRVSQLVQGMPVYPLRRGEDRLYLDWPGFTQAERLIKLRVGSERVSWPSYPEEIVTKFFWHRHRALASGLPPGMPFLTTHDATELVDAMLDRHYRPEGLVIDPDLGATYLVHRRGLGARQSFGPTPCLPCQGPDGAVDRTTFLTFWDTWVLNSAHPLAAAMLALPAGSEARRRCLKHLRDLREVLRILPERGQAQAVARCTADCAAAVGQPAPDLAANLVPAHDFSEYWQAAMLKFLEEGAAYSY